MESRENVYGHLNRERDYQESLKPNWCPNWTPSIAEELVLAEEYLNRAKHAWSTIYGDLKAGLNELRSVAAICVRCFENHGFIERADAPRKSK